MRCLETVRPFAETDDDPLIAAPELTEDGALEDPAAAARAVHRLAEAGSEVALCTHRPVLPAVLGAIRELATPGARDGLPEKDPWLAKGEVLVAHLTRSPEPVVRAVGMAASW